MLKKPDKRMEQAQTALIRVFAKALLRKDNEKDILEKLIGKLPMKC